MPLIADLHRLLARLAPHGWHELLLRHGLDVMVPQTALAAELAKPLVIDRTQLGFEEFAFDGMQGVQPGVPGRSLLYHALASADVQPAPAPGQAAIFPTLAELDTVENYIYATVGRKLSDFSNPVLAVMSFQYREAGQSPHRRHADLAFSRCGVARVGSESARYFPAGRCFDPRPADGDRGFAVLPARYALFIAEYRAPSAADQVMRSITSDANQVFLFPVHKIFDGGECLRAEDGTPLKIGSLRFAEFHINEKLRRMHVQASDNPGFVPPLPGFRTDEPPFVRTTRDSIDLVELQAVGASVLTVPVAAPIARTSTQQVAGVDELLRFSVPPADSGNRFWTSLQLSSTSNGRSAPEYANMRQRVVAGTEGAATLQDMNQLPDQGMSQGERFDSLLDAGGFNAAHFLDGTCDGVVSCHKPPALTSLLMFPAYSLVSAIDYMPLVEQVEVLEWLERLAQAPVGLADTGAVFPQGGPAPLSDGRFRKGTPAPVISQRVPNQALRDPGTPAAVAAQAFPLSEAASRSVTAIVGRAASAGAAKRSGRGPFVATWLPDAASDVFAPGWDISTHQVGAADAYASYGLGSPFPEDAKLCAALNSFWPAAAPDSSRTYGFPDAGSTQPLFTSIPLTDSELGRHALNPAVQAGTRTASLGWDGDTGPFLVERSGAHWVNASNVRRADQTRAALDGLLSFSGLADVHTEDLIERIQALVFCRRRVLPQATARRWWLVSFDTVADWSAVTPAQRLLSPTLSGRGLVFTFVLTSGAPQPASDPPLRLEYPVQARIDVHMDAVRAVMQQDGTGPVRTLVRD